MSVHEPTAKDDEPLEQPNDEVEEETEESAAFIVSVGEHEEDLDYDLKDANKQARRVERKTRQMARRNHPRTGLSTKTGN